VSKNQWPKCKKKKNIPTHSLTQSDQLSEFGAAAELEITEDMSLGVGKKMDLLLEHYHLKDDDPERWQKLSFRLALDHIAECKSATASQKTRGAP
jgi:hypothetical protein